MRKSLKILHKSYSLIIAAIISLLIIFPFANINLSKDIDEKLSVDKFADYLNENIPQLMSNFNVPGLNISLIKNYKKVWSKAFGYADVETKREMTTDTYCRLESISKSVTAWGIMKLAEQKKIKLDEPVTNYLQNWTFPPSEYSTEKITILQLLTHTSGLTLGNIGVIYSPTDILPSLQQSLTENALLFQEPGTSFSYSNTGYHLLELLIEEVTGQTFEEFMRKEILLPLGMNKSTFIWSEKFYPPVANGYDLKGTPIPVYIYPEKAAGGLFSTIEDLGNFVIAGMSKYNKDSNNVLSLQSIDEMYDSYVKPGQYSLAFDYYGFGHFIEKLPAGKKAIAAGGQGTGWMTHFHSVPETGDGIIILTNSQRSWPLFAYILNDWAKWSGFGSVGMSVLIKARIILWIIVFILLTFSLWQIIQIIVRLTSGNLRLVLFKELLQLKIIIKFLSGAIILLIVVWAMGQKYLFIKSVFPIASFWLGYSLLFFSIILVLTVLFRPKRVITS